MPVERKEECFQEHERVYRKVYAPLPGMQLADELWRDLPELIRGYAPDDRYDVRELAYSVFDRYAKTHDEHGITRLRFAMTTQQDLRTEFFGKEPY